MSQQAGIYISNKGTYNNVPKPSAGNLTYFLNANDGDKLYAMKSDRSVFAVSVLSTANGPYANDAAASAAGIPIGGLYHNAGAVRIRLV
jgi:hypothetical protein